ncbi:MAG TPA: Vi polysaccharide biosynthesis protein VipA/TviB, partial [Spongiibacteraceae bacterium]|nr:Vi polysaccharide biosynthesis protein VipA/TviB [Spongiibacteraceae bacterium]
MGLTFKENCPDLRNTRVVDVVEELKEYGVNVSIYDPWVSPSEAKSVYGVDVLETLEPDSFDGIILAVAHSQFREMGVDAVRALGRKQHVLYDLKYVFPSSTTDLRL